MNMCRRSGILVLLLSLALPISAAASSLNVVIERPDGRCHLNLAAEIDGPIWLPVDSKEIEAVQLATETTENSVIVTVSAVRDALSIDPLARHELSLDSRPVELYELEPYGIEGWSLSLLLVSQAEAENCPGGCGCGGLCCYPNPGKCMSCGDCGTCCAAPN